MPDLRQLEADLAQNLEDSILQTLGYREYAVSIGATSLEPRPQVTEVDVKAIPDFQVHKYLTAMGPGANMPNAIFSIEVSRNVPEDLVRSRDPWTITRGSRVSTCKLIDLMITDTRFIATVGVMKTQNNL